MQAQQKNNNRTYRNHSNITFGQEQGASTSGNPDNYRTHSQIGKLLSEHPARHGNDNKNEQETYHYSNKIFQRERDYTIPHNMDPTFEKNNQEYRTHFNKQNNRFIKPYAQCTRYVDNLMQNKQLLRRGQFDLPTQNIDLNVGSSYTKTRTKTNPSHPHTKTQNTEFIRSRMSGLSHRQKNQQTMESIRKRNQRNMDEKKGFDKTLQSHFHSYQNLMNEERWSKKQQNGLKNSMNRVLAAEMINFRLMSASNTLRPTRSVKLDK